MINARPCSPAIHSSAARASSQAPGCCSASFARAAAVQSRPRSTPCTGDAARATDTRWDQILQLYDQLLEYTPTPVIALNRAVALAVVHGPQAALDLVDRLDLDTYQPYHATRADLLRRLGRKPEAAAAYQAAIALSSNDTERAYLAGRLRMLS